MANKFSKSNAAIQVLSRALLWCEDFVVLCRNVGTDNFYLPGGHVENGESAKAALARELDEKLGLKLLARSDPTFAGVCENVYEVEPGVDQHELNMIFEVKLPANIEIKSREAHLEFTKVSQSELAGLKILPEQLKTALIKWLGDREVFYVEI